MRIGNVDGYIEINSEEGKYITNGSVYATRALLGTNDSIENWMEVDSIPEPEPEPEPNNGLGG